MNLNSKVPALWIILPVHNRVKITLEFIHLLKSQTYTTWQLLLVDDGSTDNTANLVKELLPTTIVLKGDGNLWWGGSLQKAYLYLKNLDISSSPSAVLIINDDLKISPTFLENGLKLLKPNTFLQAQMIDPFEKATVDIGTRIYWATFSFKPAQTVEQINCLSTRGLLMPLETFLEGIGFRAKLFPHHACDYDFTHRAFRRGVKLTSSKDFFISSTDHADKARYSFAKPFGFHFTRRSPLNPIYKLNLVLYLAPWLWKPIGFMRVGLGFFKVLIFSLIFSVRNLKKS